MRSPARLSAFLLALTVGTTLAQAQPYPGLQPVPKSTDAAALRKIASAREVHERFRLGLDALSRSDFPAAAAEFRRLIALAPPEPRGSTAQYDLGLAEAGAGNNAAAAHAFTAAIALDSDFLAARANLVTVQVRAGDLAAARKSADEFVARAPAAARARYERGIVALHDGDAGTAARDFGLLLERDPKYATAHYDLALAELDLGHLAEAERELRAALTLAPAYARARFALGAVLLRSGKRDDARSAFDDAARAAQDVTLRNLALSMRDSIAH